MNITDISRLMNATGPVNFQTEIKDTRGYLTVDGNGNVKNVGRHWYNFFSKPTDARKNQETRTALINAFRNSNLDANVIAKAMEELGAFDKAVITTPLSRRTVKQILRTVNESTASLASETSKNLLNEFKSYNEKVIKPKMTEVGVSYDRGENGEHFCPGGLIESNFVQPIIKFASERIAAAKAGHITIQDAKRLVHQYVNAFLKDPYNGADDKELFNGITIKALKTLKDLLDTEMDRVIGELAEKRDADMEQLKKDKNISDKYLDVDDMNDSDLSDDE